MTWSDMIGKGMFVGVGVMAPASYSGCSKTAWLGNSPDDCTRLRTLGVSVAVDVEADMVIEAYDGGLVLVPWLVPALPAGLGLTLGMGVAPSNGGEGSGPRILLMDCNSCCVSFLL